MIKVKPNEHATSVPVYTWVNPVTPSHVPAYLTWEHARIHDGMSYDACYMKGLGSELADLASMYILIQVASPIHLIYEVSIGGNAEVYFYTGTTFTNQGTVINSFNKNDYSTNTSSSVISHTPTITGNGTQKFAKFLPGGVKTAGSGGSDGSFSRERNLKTGEVSLIRVRNISGAVQPVSVCLEWYEL